MPAVTTCDNLINTKVAAATFVIHITPAPDPDFYRTITIFPFDHSHLLCSVLVLP